MDNRAGHIDRVPKRRGSSESDDHWLENIDMERSGTPEDGDAPELDGDDELAEEFVEEFEQEEVEEEEDFRA